MKTIYRFTLVALLMHLAIPSEAQLLNKIKNKVNEQLNKADEKVSGEKTAQESSSATGSTSSENRANPSSSEALKGVEKTLIYKLDAGERIDYRESRIMVSSDNKVSGLVIVNKSGARYVVENGVKKGPYTVKTIPLDFLKQTNKAAKTQSDNIDPQEMIAIYQNYIKTDNDNTYIVFNGKKHGPFSTLDAMKVNPQKTKFVAVISIDIDDNNKQKFLVNQEGKKIELAKGGQLFGQIVVNSSFTDAAFWGQDLAAAYAQTGGMQSVLATLSGNKQVINPQLNSVWYDAYNHLLATNEKTVFLNGKVLKEFERTVGSDWRDIWLNSDGSAWAALVDNQLHFSDGSKIDDGFSVGSSNQNGKTVLSWVAVSKQDYSVTRYAKTL
ncbi:hypothetical protein [Solitalea lacus]|uniref:hypothetical protein n=1 Tax=Solitalea lacus TaxID=2911172 RepID=UPI001EDB126C|nr:hypothetical protein [Solitalea lacus]UKJ09292.1 hypothetical protein L2B55_09060 [Solitalea lacus]